MLFVVTGGTIDKQPSFLEDGVTFNNDSKIFTDTHLPEMLRRAKFLGDYSIKTVCMVDSLDMTDNDRADISRAIEEAEDTSVVITHGTDTMPDTAIYLKRNANLAAKTIVLTGAMVPYSMGDAAEFLDATFNLGTAIAYASTLPSGIYVAMNGQAFDATNVRKDVQAGVFKTL